MNLTSLLWLVAGTILLAAVTRIPSIAIAMWLALAFLLHGARTLPARPGLVLLAAALYVALFAGSRVTIPLSGPMYLVAVALVTLTAWLPFASDRLFAPRLTGWASTLLFPLTWVTLEFLRARFLPPATWGASGYTQYGNLPLMQLASVTGIWGIAFLVAWGASIVGWAWDQPATWVAMRSVTVCYLCLMTGVLLAGSLRIALAPPGRATMRVAALTYPKDVYVPGDVTRIAGGQFSAADHETLGAKMRRAQDSLLERSRAEARAGARLVGWGEMNLLVFKDDEDAFLARARAIATDGHVYLAMGMGTISPGASKPLENKVVLVDPAGTIPFSHHKSRPVPGWEASIMVRGDGHLPVVDTSDGRLGAAICFEGDHPDLVRQLGHEHADVWIEPVNEWKGIERTHLEMAVFRAIETGAPLLRPASSGVSAAVDPWGRVLAMAADPARGGSTMIAELPIGHVDTIYARVGDLFAWLCVVGAVILPIVAMWAPHA
jgi:apolipoprotein N-acyltransferase